ncbi:Hypothetical_protein [Hexamita inflata]|uniref:Hypothetical_protein n=1 Tax=Hexamita inflata TaxID=28002 RepID=A0AA86NTP0_9EUKA|nr:Hypothetical protein HINF_LOCUS12281 [Hexamita inflata]
MRPKLSEEQLSQILFENTSQILYLTSNYIKLASSLNEYELVCPGFELLVNSEKCYCSRRARIQNIYQTDFNLFLNVINEKNEIVPKTEENIQPQMLALVFEGDHINCCQYTNQMKQNVLEQSQDSTKQKTQEQSQVHSTPSQSHSGLLKLRPNHRRSSLNEERIIQMLVDDKDYHIQITQIAPNTHYLSTGQATLKAPSAELFEALDEALQIKSYAYNRLVIFLNFDEQSIIAFLKQYENELNQIAFYDFIQKYNVRCVYGNQVYSVESLKLLFDVLVSSPTKV